MNVNLNEQQNDIIYYIIGVEINDLIMLINMIRKKKLDASRFSGTIFCYVCFCVDFEIEFFVLRSAIRFEITNSVIGRRIH